LLRPTSSSVKASGSSSAATTALWPISSTTIMAVSWSSGWLMVTIWPSFISCLMTSEALTAILCASSATVMVSGTCTSRCARFRPVRTWIVTVAVIATAATRATTPVVAAHATAAVAAGLDFFLLGRIASPAGGQLGRLDFLASGGTRPGGCGAHPARGTPVPTAGLCSVPFLASAPAAGLATGLGSSGFLATMTFLGVAIIERMAAASASALRRRRPDQQLARCFFIRAGLGFSCGLFAGFHLCGIARAASAACSRVASSFTAEACAFLLASWAA
jgi:hypothetical protein